MVRRPLYSTGPQNTVWQPMPQSFDCARWVAAIAPQIAKWVITRHVSCSNDNYDLVNNLDIVSTDFVRQKHIILELWLH